MASAVADGFNVGFQTITVYHVNTATQQFGNVALQGGLIEDSHGAAERTNPSESIRPLGHKFHENLNTIQLGLPVSSRPQIDVGHSTLPSIRCRPGGSLKNLFTTSLGPLFNHLQTEPLTLPASLESER